MRKKLKEVNEEEIGISGRKYCGEKKEQMQRP